MSRPPPLTVEYLEATAATDPQRLALWEEGRALSYAQLHGLVAQCALALQRLGVRRGERLAVAGPGFGLQLVVLLAAEGLGAVTLSFQADDDPDLDFLLTQVDRVFSGRPLAVPPQLPFHLLDEAFVRALAAPLGAARPAWVPLPFDAPQRITRTSGSSGRSKFMLLSRQALEWQIATTVEMRGWEMLPGTRMLVLCPLVVNWGYSRGSACLRRGGAIVVGGGASIAEMAPTHVFGLPLQLQRLLAEMPPDYRPPRPVSVATFGGAVPADLRRRAEAVFGGTMHNRYGSNEVGVVCDELDATGTGVVRQGVDARIVGPDGADVPWGQDGILVMRSPGLPQGYLGRPQETAAAFRDGWFHSGDVAAWVAPRLLRLAGRHDDLVAVGGIKVPAARLEQQLRAQPAIADAAVVTALMDGGAASLGIAVVAAAGADPADVGTQVQQALANEVAAPARLLVLSDLPRMQSGKLDRMALLRLFQAGR